RRRSRAASARCAPGGPCPGTRRARPKRPARAARRRIGGLSVAVCAWFRLLGVATFVRQRRPRSVAVLQTLFAISCPDCVDLAAGLWPDFRPFPCRRVAGGAAGGDAAATSLTPSPAIAGE